MPSSTKSKASVVDVPLPPEWVEMDDRPGDTAPEEPTIVGEIIALTNPVEDEPRAMIPVSSAVQTDHVITGLGMLAKMSDAEFQEKLAMLQRGRERVGTIQKTLMRKGEDYGEVSGIPRPFLFLPGAEQLEKFYGFASTQSVRRVVGDGVTAPPLTYLAHITVHLGNTDGPVIAEGDGEANSWEIKYRYTEQRPTCPDCGHELIKRKSPPNLAGKWNCPSWQNKGGCNRVFEPNDPRITSGGKIENPDPHSLAETLLQMSAKRAYVAGIRRATGTSGLFTIDEDSPSVRAQVDSEPSDGQITSEAAPVGIQVGVGAKTTEATQVQHNQLARLAKEKGLGGVQIADLLNRLFGLDVEPTGKAATAAVKGLDAGQMGRLLHSLSTGEVPAPAEATPGEPPQQSDEMR